MMGDKGLHVLTHREKMVAELLSQGASNKKIASSLGISDGVAKNYTLSIYRKFGISNGGVPMETRIKFIRVWNGLE